MSGRREKRVDKTRESSLQSLRKARETGGRTKDFQVGGFPVY